MNRQATHLPMASQTLVIASAMTQTAPQAIATSFALRRTSLQSLATAFAYRSACPQAVATSAASSQRASQTLAMASALRRTSLQTLAVTFASSRNAFATTCNSVSTFAEQRVRGNHGGFTCRQPASGPMSRFVQRAMGHRFVHAPRLRAWPFSNQDL